MLHYEFTAMGTSLSLWLDTQMPCAQSANGTETSSADIHALCERVRQAVEQWESIFSRFRVESELSHLNRILSASRGLSALSRREHSLPLSADMAEVLDWALHTCHETNGVVTPWVHDAVCRVGYDRDFAQLPRHRSSVAHEPILPLNGVAAHVVWRDCNQPVLHILPQAQPLPRLDLGGFVKGWCADTLVRLVAQLAPDCPVLMDVGGDIAVSGLRRDGTPWEVEIAQPYAAADEPELAVVALGSGTMRGIATSGRDRRHWQVDGRPHHHIIDPSTGQSAVSDLLTVTVMAQTSRRAEVIAKQLLIMGYDGACVWLEQQTDLSVWLVRNQGQLEVIHAPAQSGL